MSKFGADIAEWASDAQIGVATDCARITRELFNWVIQLSPIDTGRFIANWHIGNDAPTHSVLSKSNYTVKQKEVNWTITDDFFLRNASAYIVNNVSYAKQVEEDGWKFTDAYAPVAKAISKVRH